MAVDMINQGVNKPTTVNNNVTSKPKTDEKKPVSKTVIGASLVGLAALASVGIYLATKGKGKVKPQTIIDEVKNPINNTQLEELQKQANELKDKIKVAYQKKLAQPFDGNLTLIEQDALRQEGKTMITSSKDFDKAKDYIIHLHENDGPHRDFYIPAKQLKENVYKDIKSKLSELQKDADWIELRKIRKNLLKQSKTSTKRDRAIIGSHIELIDNILLSKVSKDSSIPKLFEDFYSMDIKDATKLAKSSTKRVFDTVDYKSEIRPFDTTVMDLRNLKLSDFFKKEVKTWNSANNTVKGVEEELIKLDEKKHEFKELQKTLAKEIRQSDDVKALKELNKQIAELSKQNSK
ncbi:MAG: hypothetical protein K6E29_07750 [Cyanobacteria bacterium RUI128]|nr:hypothetical protein [Cyanobacteria bacterium RUI128]